MKALFYPDFPELELYTIVAVFNRLNYFATTDIHGEYDFVVSWQDKTWVENDSFLKNISRKKPVINLNCNDISKHKVDELFGQLAGYTCVVDPLSYHGKMVVKPNENAVARGQIVDGPIDKVDNEMVYQAFIDCRENDELKTEYRVPITFGEIPCVYLQRKIFHETQAKTIPSSTELRMADDVFSELEIRMINQFCQLIGLDSGDLDILRDFQTNQLYIIDANKTGGGFGLLNRFCWSIEDRTKAIELVAKGFEAGLKEKMKMFI